MAPSQTAAYWVTALDGDRSKLIISLWTLKPFHLHITDGKQKNQVMMTSEQIMWGGVGSKRQSKHVKWFVCEWISVRKTCILKTSDSRLGNAIFLDVSLRAQKGFWVSQLNSFSICLNSLWLSAQKTDAHLSLIVDYCSHQLIIRVEGKRLPGKQANIVITAKRRQIVKMSILREIVATDLFSIMFMEGALTLKCFLQPSEANQKNHNGESLMEESKLLFSVLESSNLCVYTERREGRKKYWHVTSVWTINLRIFTSCLILCKMTQIQSPRKSGDKQQIREKTPFLGKFNSCSLQGKGSIFSFSSC